MKTLVVARPRNGKITATAGAGKCSGCSTTTEVVAFQVRGPVYGVRLDLCSACLRIMGELMAKVTGGKHG